jgi:hypothetical protein
MSTKRDDRRRTSHKRQYRGRVYQKLNGGVAEIEHRRIRERGISLGLGQDETLSGQEFCMPHLHSEGQPPSGSRMDGEWAGASGHVW